MILKAAESFDLSKAKRYFFIYLFQLLFKLSLCYMHYNWCV